MSVWEALGKAVFDAVGSLVGTACCSRAPSNHRATFPTYTRGPAAIIRDNFASLEEVSSALAEAGLESSSLLVAIDFTKSNEWAGKRTHGGACLHTRAPDGTPPPYATALGAVARTLARFDDDGLIPAWGFGCARTSDSSLFSLLPGDAPCDGLPALVARYSALAPHVRLAGPTSFAPAIRRAIEIVAATNAYHILVIVADGQVTRSTDAEPGELSRQERETIAAIVDASDYALSILIVGVGDGPWDMMEEFDDALPARRFDNLQFIALSSTLAAAAAMAPAAEPARANFIDAYFATRALMEIPDQWRAIQREGLLGARATAQRERTNNMRRNPPIKVLQPPLLPPNEPEFIHAANATAAANNDIPMPSTECPLCKDRAVDCVLGCGHPFCRVCIEQWRASQATAACPRCNANIARVTPLFV